MFSLHALRTAGCHTHDNGVQHQLCSTSCVQQDDAAGSVCPWLRDPLQHQLRLAAPPSDPQGIELTPLQITQIVTIDAKIK